MPLLLSRRALLSSVLGAALQRGALPPNIVLLLADDLGYVTVGEGYPALQNVQIGGFGEIAGVGARWKSTSSSQVFLRHASSTM